MHNAEEMCKDAAKILRKNGSYLLGLRKGKKKALYNELKRSRTIQAYNKYKKAAKNAKRVIAIEGGQQSY